MNQPSTPQYPQIQASNVVSGADATNQAMSLANQYFAPQMGAQAQGISDINQGQSYYNNFGPSTLSQAIGNQYFSNVWPQEQSMIQNQFANSGMNFSPAMASTEANAYGTLGTNVGEYEQGISNQNATNNLSQLMSINPNSYYQPISNTITGQSNEQAQLSQQAAAQNAQAQYMNSSAAYQQQLSSNGALGTGVGAGLGALAGYALAPVTGGGSLIAAGIGAGLGGALGGSVMGGGSASSLGNAMQAMSYYGNQPGMMPGQYGMQNSTNMSGVNASQQPNYSNLTSSGYGVGASSGVTNGSSNAYGMGSFGS